MLWLYLGYHFKRYKIPFNNTPPSICLQNNRSAIIHGEFITEAIHDLLIRGLVEECENQPYVVNPLTVSPSNNRKKRLILDLRHLWKTSIKFEDILIAMEIITNNSFCFQFDVRISPCKHCSSTYRFSRFILEVRNVKWFAFFVLPFGLSSACYICTKITRPLIKKWGGEGKQVLMYLDDGLGNLTSEGIWLQNVLKAIGDIEFYITRCGKMYSRLIASLVGQIVSMLYAIGNVAYIMTKH